MEEMDSGAAELGLRLVKGERLVPTTAIRS